MRIGDVVRLVALAAIWGASFIFIRVLAPVLGPVITTDLRVLIAGLAQLAYFKAIRFDVGWRANWKHYLIVGAVNSALPFLLYSFAALHIPASYSVIFNSTSPLFGAIFSALWLGSPLTWGKIWGLILGASGVALLAGVSHVAVDAMFVWSGAACLGAAICYALAGVYIKKFAPHVPAMGYAGGSQVMAGLLLLPPIALSPLRGEITPLIVANLLGLSLLCSAIAYLIYYRLIADVGPTKALTVTFLMPVFGMIWGAVFLGEKVTAPMVLGSALIVGGTAFVARSPKA